LEDKEVRQLVEQAKRGDAEAMARLCEHLYPLVLQYARCNVGSDIAEDIANDVFLRVVRSLHAQRGSFLAWMYRIARNRIADHARARAVRSRFAHEKTANPDAIDHDDPAKQTQRRVDIEDAIRALTDEQREFVILKFMQGLSNAEISEIMDKRVEALRALQFRALKSLRSFLARDES